MAGRHKNAREVDIFNFSFLDILACVIGLLIFVLTIVVVSGGGPQAARHVMAVAEASRRFEHSREAAQAAAKRRAIAETQLADRAAYVSDPAQGAETLRAQIRKMDEETAKLDAANNTIAAQIGALSTELAVLAISPLSDPSVSAIKKQIGQLDQETQQLRQQADEERRKAAAKVTEVKYYLPHVREVHRKTLWVWVSQDRVWGIETSDFHPEPISEDSTKYVRRPGAAGFEISKLPRGEMPSYLQNVESRDVCLQVALRSDGYQSFRVLRQWAWERGFSVNWTPGDWGEIILTRSSHVFEQ